jgi:hypothetical protein
MSTGMGGLQSLISQLGGQGASGNPYVSPALGGGGEKIPQAGTAMARSYKDMPANYQEARDAFDRQGGGMTAGQAMTRDQFGNQWSSTAANEFDSFYNKNYGGAGSQQPIATPPQQLGAASLPYRPVGSGGGMSSAILSGSSGSLNSMPSMGGSAGAGGSGGPFPLQGQYGIVKMANGGLANAAQNMAGRGRDGDSMLVHMSPGEVKGLQALAMAHGGSLSINPDTGLVEASFLKRILPMIAGAGLSMIPGVGPFMAAGMVGGFETMRTGDIGKGLMAGLGAYGGAGLAGGLSNAAASTAVDANARNLAELAVQEGSTTAGMAEATRNIGTPTLSSIGEGAKQVFSSPETLGQFGKQNLMNIGAAAAPVLGDAMTPKGPAIPGEPEEDPRYAGSPYRYNLASGFQGSTPTRPNPYYRPTGLGYAEGGDIMMAQGGAYDDEPMGDNPGMAAGGIAGYAAGGLKMGQGIAKDTDQDTASLGAYDAAKKRMEKQFAAANLKPREMPKSGIAKLGQMKAMAEGGLGSYSDGGRMLKGPGDGMSDDIPAVIGRKQPARLADGEFVVPADVVSHLGNGSTDAGAKKLYSMMDKIRTARTGKKKQAPAVKASKYMPA